MNRQVIEAKKGFFNLDFAELGRYRQLIWSLAWRDLKVKYAQTLIGLLWALLVPLTTLAIFVFVFDKVVKVDTGSTPYALFAIAGLTAWSYFSSLLTEAGNALISSQEMIKKIYFPKLVIPISKSLSSLVEFVITLICLFAVLVYYQVMPGTNVIYLPIFILLVLIAGLTGGIWVSALTVRYRDVKFITPFIARMGLYITPVAYPVSMVPEQYKALFYLNPMAGIVEGFRWSLLGTEAPDPQMWYSIGFLVLLFVLGLLYFGKVERTMADLI